jgi:hypothetical protein
MTVKTKVPHHQIIAKRIRIERVELFSRIAQAEKALRAMLNVFTVAVTEKVIAKGTSLANLRAINAVLHKQTVILRASMRVWMTALLRDGVKMGLRHPGDALKPIFKNNQEAVTEIIAEQAIFEARLSFGLDTSLTSRATPGVKQTSAKWSAIRMQIYQDALEGKLSGVAISERIWDLTLRAEQDLKRMIANGIAQGRSPYEIAKSIEKYVSPQVGLADELGVQTGPGVYRSPYRNAMRIARTETSRAYNQASASFYKNKPWVSEVLITLSPNHDVEDECDDATAGGPYSPEEGEQTLMDLHPHCMCTLTPIINPEYLGEEEEGD